MKRVIVFLVAMILVTTLIIAGCTAPATTPSPAPAAPAPAPAPAQVAKPAPSPSPAPASAPAPAAKPKKIVLQATAFMPGTLSRQPLQVWVDEINKRGGDEIQVKIIGGPEVIPANDQPAAVKSGVLDITYINSARYYSEVPEANADTYSPLYPWEQREKGIYDLLIKYHARAGYRYLGNITWGYLYEFWTNFQITQLSDLKGKKIRSGGGSIAFLKALGVEPAFIDLGETYTAIERKIVDGAATTATQCSDLKLYEVAKFGHQPGVIVSRTNVLMSLSKYNSLPPKLQDLINSTMKDAEPNAIKVNMQTREESWKTIRASKMKVVELEAAVAKELTDKVAESGWAALEKDLKPESAAELKKVMFGK